MSSIKNLVLVFLIIVLGSCRFEKYENDIIETKTTLNTIEISNYLPNSTNSISNGYTKMSYTKMGLNNYVSFKEEFGKADVKNTKLYFDSADFSFLKKIQKTSILSTDQINTLINENNIKLNNDYPDLVNKKLNLVSVITKLERDLMITLEVPNDNTLNWSIIKIWTIDKELSRPQIHSVLFAKANNFDSLGFMNNSILLRDGNFIYRLVIDKEYRFNKNMDIYVSVDSNNEYQ